MGTWERDPHIWIVGTPQKKDEAEEEVKEKVYQVDSRNDKEKEDEHNETEA